MTDSGLRVVAPYELDLLRVVLVGTALWLIAIPVLFGLHGTLSAHGHGGWPWIAVGGASLGLLGAVVEVRRRRIDAARAAVPSASATVAA